MKNNVNFHIKFSIFRMETVNQCRDIVKLFKLSPSRNAILQKYVKLVEGKELKVLLDLKILWSSLEKMLTRFMSILKLMEDTLDDINRTDMWAMWDPENTETAELILIILEPLPMTVNQLSNRNFDLLQAEGVLEFLFEELAEQDNIMNNLLLVQLKVEIGKRRDKSLVSLLRFLADPNSLTNQTVDPFFAMS
jgi:hypothetical protein